MDTTQPKLYCGIHEDTWNNLLLKAEDLLRDEGLGAHLVGIYPAGTRIYGTRPGVEGLMCLYVDAVDSLINPLARHKKCKVFDADDDGQQIIMFNLFWWVNWILEGPSDWKTRQFMHAIPFGDVIDQDESVSDIIDTARKFLTTKRFASAIFNEAPAPYNILAKRTQLILSATSKFMPCVNPDYAKVFPLDHFSAPDRIKKLDRKVSDILIAGGYPKQDQLEELDLWYRDMTHFFESQAAYQRGVAEKLAELTERLYRFQL